MRIRRLRWIGWLAGLLIAAAGGAQTVSGDAPDAVVWSRVIPELEKIRELEDRHDQLPGWHPWRTTKKKNQERIDAVLDEVVGILGISPVRNLREEIAGLEQATRDDEAAIAALKERRISAPEESLFGATVERIDEQIAELQETIAARQGRIEAKRQGFREQVATLGLDLTPEQTDFLLATVVGDTILDLCVAFYNVRLITNQLAQLTAESLETLEIARRYYGMYAVLLKSVVAVYDAALEQIEEEYLVELNAVMERTEALMEQTRGLMRGADRVHRSALEGNLRAQEFALEAAGTYREYLLQQERDLRLARRQVEQNVVIAGNTYETVKISGDLLRVMRASDELFELLVELNVPELKPFKNLELRREFEKLTDRLRAEEG